MLIREMNREECLRVLAGTKLARLACARQNQPYIVPVYLAYHTESSGAAYLYGFTTLGQKVAWMRANPLVCVEVDDVEALDQWTSIVANGCYEELPATPRSVGAYGRAPERSENLSSECDGERELAWNLLKTHPMWQEPGATAWSVRAHRDAAKTFEPIFYRIRIDLVTGHKATRDSRDSMALDGPLLLGDKVAGAAY